MALITLRDYHGVFEVALFPENYKRYKTLIIPDVPMIVKGKVSIRNGARTMIVEEIKHLS